ncbi:MAG: cytochrome c oxidase accessory protein CcoG [Pseudomonadota bacterium]
MNESDKNTAIPTEDKVQAVSLYEKHKKIYVRAVKGWWQTWRWVLVFVTQIIFYGTPWLEWNDRQAILFHLVERKFYLFGLVLWPQDVFYLALLLIISAYALFLFTAVAGRLFCGYACPQTVYTEIFVWVEQKIEGNRPEQIKLDKSPLNANKLKLKLLKHAAWLSFSLITGYTFVAYFTPISELNASLLTGDFGSWEIFWIFFYGGFTYLMAGFMREQVCKYMCPYARFQSVMFDPDTLVITYDPVRGEPRGQRKKNSADTNNLGDCVDCGICVQVCPVGIDIRKGLQYECIGCGACVDGCDEVMDKIGLPRGLVRYTTENVLDRESQEVKTCGKGCATASANMKAFDILKHNIRRPRIVLYSVILGLLVIATTWSMSVRVPLKVDLIRDRSSLAREADDGRIENIYTMKIMNATESPHVYSISVSGLDGVDLVSEKEIAVEAASNHEVTVSVRVAEDVAPKGSHKIYFDVQAKEDAKIAVHEKASFILPN